MERFQKIELVVLSLILVMGIVSIVYLLNPGLTGFYLLNSNNNIGSPADRISEKDIIADSEKVVIKVDNPVLSRYDNSESMIPVIYNGATGVGMRPKSESEIQIGDIVSFYQNEISVVHRIVEKGIDEQGVYFITKGDNNNLDDGKIRFKDIDSVLVAVIY